MKARVEALSASRLAQAVSTMSLVATFDGGVVRWRLTDHAADALVHNSEHMHWLRPHCMCCVEHYELSRMS